MSKLNPLFAFVMGMFTATGIGIFFTALELWTPFFRTPVRVDIPLTESGFDWSGWAGQQSHYVVAYVMAALMIGLAVAVIGKIYRGKTA